MWGAAFLLVVAMAASSVAKAPTSMKNLTFLTRDECVNTPDPTRALGGSPLRALTSAGNDSFPLERIGDSVDDVLFAGRYLAETKRAARG